METAIDMEDPAQLALTDQMTGIHCRRRMSPGEVDAGHHTRRIRRRFHSARFVHIHGHGLFTDDMLAGSQCGDGDFRMRVVRGDDGNGIHIGPGQQFVHVTDRLGNVISIGHAPGALDVGIAHRHRPGARMALTGRNKMSGPHSRTDHTYSDLLFH